MEINNTFSKICKSCQIAKSLTEYYKDEKAKDKKRSICKACQSSINSKNQMMKYKPVPQIFCQCCNRYLKKSDNYEIHLISKTHKQREEKSLINKNNIDFVNNNKLNIII